MYQIGWFSTGRGSGSRSLLKTVWDSIQNKELKVTIPFVFSNREQGEAEGSDMFFQQVQGYGIPLIKFSSKYFESKSTTRMTPEWRLEYDREIMARLAG